MQNMERDLFHSRRFDLSDHVHDGNINKYCKSNQMNTKRKINTKLRWNQLKLTNHTSTHALIRLLLLLITRVLCLLSGHSCNTYVISLPVFVVQKSRKWNDAKININKAQTAPFLPFSAETFSVKGRMRKIFLETTHVSVFAEALLSACLFLCCCAQPVSGRQPLPGGRAALSQWQRTG